MYNVVSRPFAINLVASPAAAALRPSLEKIKRYRATLLIFNKRENFGVYLLEISPICFYSLEKCSDLGKFRKLFAKVTQFIAVLGGVSQQWNGARLDLDSEKKRTLSFRIQTFTYS